MRIDHGIVLAGGRGVRLGAGVPKALAELHGTTLLDRAVKTLGECCGEVMVVAPAAIVLDAPAARRVMDVSGCEGPLAGLVAGLEACSGETAAILGVDFPLVTSVLFRDLHASLDPGFDAVLMRPGGIAQPLVSVMRVSATTRLRAALDTGVRSLWGGFERLAVRWLDEDAIARITGGPEALLNVNTPADLEAARLALVRGPRLSRRHGVSS